MSVSLDELRVADAHAVEEELDHHDTVHITVGGYLTGFVLSVILTAIPFWLVMARVFERHGLPEVIRSDNGSPFACSSSPLGLSRLSAWWLMPAAVVLILAGSLRRATRDSGRPRDSRGAGAGPTAH